MARRLGARSGLVVTAQVSRPHLACRIACLFGATRCQAETAVTFVARSLCVGETAITFARSKCVSLRHCGRAKVSLVSCVPVNERAKAVAVSFGREIVLPAALVIAKARNSSPCALTTPHIWRLCVRWASVSRKSRWRGCAGRVFSRKSHWRGCAGRVFSRSSSRVILLGELCRAVTPVAGPSTGSVNSLMRSYTRWVAWWAERPAHHPSG